MVKCQNLWIVHFFHFNDGEVEMDTLVILEKWPYLMVKWNGHVGDIR